MKARHLFYSGHVQGVGFRYSLRQIAAGYEVAGFVRNLPDGRVESWIQGPTEEIGSMEQEILRSHLKGFIKTVESYDVEARPDLKGFSIV